MIFITNDTNVEQQGSGQGETGYGNNDFALPITVTAPDLAITAATAPPSAILSAAISVSWTVKDIGSVAAPGDWSDAVFIGNSPKLSLISDTFVARFDENGESPLTAGASYTDSESITLPSTITAGNQYLIFVTNFASTQGETNDANNSFAVPISVSAPDLTITSASAPAATTLSEPISVSWTVKNIGSVAAPGDWSHAFYIGSSPTFDPNKDILITSDYEGAASPLAAGASYTDDDDLYLPANTPTGNDYLIFVTNAAEAQGETNYTNDAYAVPITVSAPDFTIVTATAPAQAIDGASINVSWTVKNIGNVEAPGDWADAVYLGSSPTFDEFNDTYITSFSQTSHSPLAAGASYTETESITVPTTATSGAHYVIFVSNDEAVTGDYQSGDAQGETDFTNNSYAVPITLSAPDLTITRATAPSSAILSSPIDVSWTVKNIGSVPVLGDWYDAVYVGSSPTFDPASDILVTSFDESARSSLAAGLTYIDDEFITLPSTLATGSQYLIFVTNYNAVESNGDDDQNSQGETDYTNNAYDLPITITAPDLTITTATAPASGTASGTINVSWAVKNIGSLAAAGNWSDAVFIGSSPTFDQSRRQFSCLATRRRNIGLAAASHTGDRSIGHVAAKPDRC